jgi:hypothetical protein
MFLCKRCPCCDAEIRIGAYIRWLNSIGGEFFCSACNRIIATELYHLTIYVVIGAIGALLLLFDSRIVAFFAYFGISIGGIKYIAVFCIILIVIVLSSYWIVPFRCLHRDRQE